jgi:hypothetical protein
MAVLHPDA